MFTDANNKLKKLFEDSYNLYHEVSSSGDLPAEVELKLFEAMGSLAKACEASDNFFGKNKQSLKSSTVYSDSFDEMVQKDFTYKGNKYTWNDSDCVYYNDNGDEDDFFMDIPEGAITSAKKPVKGMTKPEGEVLREIEDDVGCLIQLVKLTNGKYLVTDNWQTEDICDDLHEANIKFNEYFM